jgi:arylsulfatase A-like enzyme
MRQSTFCWNIVLLVGLITPRLAIAAEQGKRRPNVLIIMIDDHPANLADVYQDSPVPTPNMRRLAARGTWFSRAYDDAPICCASRTALLTGVHATRSGVYYNNQAYRRAPNFIAKVTTLPGQFLKAGYLTVGYGKIAHNSWLADDVGDYTPGYYKYLNNPADVTYPEAELLKQVIPGSLHVIPGKAASNWTWGVLPDDWDRDDPKKLQQDTEQANSTIEVLRADHDRPFFMVCGLYRPHGPWTVAKRYYDRFPLESIKIPAGYLPATSKTCPSPAAGSRPTVASTTRLSPRACGRRRSRQSTRRRPTPTSRSGACSMRWKRASIATTRSSSSPTTTAFTWARRTTG